MKHKDNYVASKKEEQLIDTLKCFEGICRIVEAYEHEVKNLHYHDDKKIESFDEIRRLLYDFAGKRYGNRSNND